MPEVQVLVEVIGGQNVIATIDPAASVETSAGVLAALCARPLVDESGKPKNWKLFAPGASGRIVPMKPDATLQAASEWARGVPASADGGFAGPGDHEGVPYLFRVRFFVPAPPRPKPKEADPGPILDEEALDLTNIDDGENALESVRRVPEAEPAKKKRRRRKKKSADDAEDSGDKTERSEPSVEAIGPVSAPEPPPRAPEPPPRTPEPPPKAPEPPPRAPEPPPKAPEPPPRAPAPPPKAPEPPPKAPEPPPKAPEPPPKAPEPPPKAPEPPPKAPEPPPRPAAPPPAPPQASIERVVAMPPLAAATPSPGQKPVTARTAVLSRADTEAMRASRATGGAAKATGGAAKATGGAAKATGIGAPPPPKKSGNAGLIGAFVVLLLVAVGFGWTLMNRGPSAPPAPAPTAPPASAAADLNLSTSLEIGPYSTGEGEAGDTVHRALDAYRSLHIRVPADLKDAAQRDRVGKAVAMIENECSTTARFDACELWSRLTYALFAGCADGGCDGNESGRLFQTSIAAAERAIVNGRSLPTEQAKAAAQRLLMAQAIRLGSHHQKLVEATAPSLAKLGRDACAKLASSPDCQALVRSQ